MSSNDKSKLDGIQAGAKNISVVNNLTSGGATSALSAEQGKILKGLVDGKAASSHTHSYLPLTGGVISGSVIKITGNQTYYANYFNTLQGNVFQGNYAAMIMENNTNGRVNFLNASGEPAAIYAQSFTPKTTLSVNTLPQTMAINNDTTTFDILNNISVINYNGKKIIAPVIQTSNNIEQNEIIENEFVSIEQKGNGEIILSNDLNAMIGLLTDAVKQLYSDNMYLKEEINHIKNNK